MPPDFSPVMVCLDAGVLDGPRAADVAQRFLRMGAAKVLAPSVAAQASQHLAASLVSLRKVVGPAPLFAVTTRPEWAFGALRLLHRLVDGIVLWGDAASPTAPNVVTAWDQLFAVASLMEGEDESGLRVLVRLEPPVLERHSSALLEGRRRAFWVPLPGRWHAPARRPVPASSVHRYAENCWVVTDAAGIRMVAEPPGPEFAPLRAPPPPGSTLLTADDRADRLLAAARLIVGDTRVLESRLASRPSSAHATEVATIAAHLERWNLLRECAQSLGRDDESFISLLTKPEGDAWKAGPVGLARMAGVTFPPGNEGWMERVLGRVAAAMALDEALPSPDVPSSSARESGGTFVFHTSQLLGLKHSPTLVLLTLAAGLLRKAPQARVVVAVEECLVPSPEEDIPVVTRRANVSSALQAEHRAWARDNGFADRVSFHYARTTDARRERTVELLSAISRVGPEAVVGFGTGASLARVRLFERHPYVEITLGGVPFSGRSHVYVPPMPAATMAAKWPEDLSRPLALRDYVYIETPEPARSWRKEDMGFPEDAVVSTTVGNRLPTEMSDEFVALVIERLRADARLRWVLVGGVEGVVGRLPSDVSAQVRLHGYEPDLAGLLSVCDLYINPFRSGGGITVSMAMKAGIAVLVRGDSIDGRSWVGDADEPWDAEGYVRQLERLTTDPEARRANGARMKARMATFNAEQSGRRLMELIDEAKALFAAGRTPVA